MKCQGAGIGREMLVSTHTRMNSLLAGTRKPTMDELVAISEAYDVSINYLLVGDEMQVT